jgi:hypothetical protein
MQRITVPETWEYARIREDIDAGRLWKARDRLQGHLRERPADQTVLGLLGDVWYAMGDLPQAGRHWWLTERDDDAASAARAAFYERFGTRPRGVLRALPRPARPEHYPDAVRRRLEEVVAAANEGGTTWRPADWKPMPEDPWIPEGRHDVRDLAAVALVLAVFFTFAVGAFNVLGWIVDLVV